MTIDLRIQLLTSGIVTITNLARRTGIERTRLNRALNGDLKLRTEEQEAVAAVLQVPAKDVFGRVGDSA